MELSDGTISNSFYKRQRVSKLIPAIENRVQIIKQRPIPTTISNFSILGTTETWKVFYCQADALDFAKNNGMDLKVFSFESRSLNGTGKRRFVCCHENKMWNNFKDRPLSFRCNYEIIPEGSACKLYFDLEFSIKLNPSLDGYTLVTTFIKIVNHFLFEKFKVHYSIEDILNLDSSSNSKFSCHLIFCNKIAFVNNKHAGNFVFYICERLKYMFDSKNCDELLNKECDITFDDISQMFIKNSSEEYILFCDQGVYTKNRNFRVFMSTKLNKDTPLVLSQLNKYAPSSDTSLKSYFIDSLITNIPKNVQLLNYGDTETPLSLISLSSRYKINKNSHGNRNGSNRLQCPYPEIWIYFESFLGENAISSWEYLVDAELLLLVITKPYNYCHNVCRYHKSNSIFYVVNIKKSIYYQKCYDPDCKGFKSAESSLPSYTMPWLAIIEDDDDEEDMLLEAVNQVEKELRLHDTEITESKKVTS